MAEVLCVSSGSENMVPQNKSPPLKGGRIDWARTNAATMQLPSADGSVVEGPTVKMTPTMALNQTWLIRARSEHEDIQAEAVRALCASTASDLVPYFCDFVLLLGCDTLSEDIQAQIAEQVASLLMATPQLQSLPTEVLMRMPGYERLLKDANVQLKLLAWVMHKIDEGDLESARPFEALAFDWQQNEAIDERVTEAAVALLERLFAPGGGEVFLSAQAEFEGTLNAASEVPPPAPPPPPPDDP